MAQRQFAPDAIAPDAEQVAVLGDRLSRRGHQEGARLLRDESDATVAAVLGAAPPALAVATLWALPEAKRERVLRSAQPLRRQQWIRNHTYPPNTVGRLMDVALAVFGPDETVAEVVARLRDLVRQALITYGNVVDAEGRLVGVLIFRELLFARADQPVREVMLPQPFALHCDMNIEEAMRSMVKRHYPEYPVVDNGGRLIGIVRGEALFAQQAYELSAQAGRMVGVEAAERLTTPWHRSLLFRHPWLQLNLLTAFAAAAVVGIFQETIDRVVLLAVFLPVLAGQSGNTGCQSLAVTLRGMTLGELVGDRGRTVAWKEVVLGLLNGALVGVTAGAGMYIYARSQDSSAALALGVVVFAAMVFACIVSGVAGTLIPRLLKRLGADPATASSIFLTTATDVVSMGALLALATIFVP